jgi:hypothetical protein
MRTAFEFALARIRPDSRVVRVYNDGLTGLLYDQAEEEALREEAPGILFGAGADLHDDEATMSALRSGRLLVYGMHTDNGIAMEVAVGAPLTDAELADGLWLQAGPGHVHLPSGRLCIHSYNSLPIGDFEPDPMEPGGRIDVSPGRYHVRLYRKDGVAPEADDSADWSVEDCMKLDEEAIGDVLVLTPFAPGEATPEVHNVLFGDCIDFDAREVAEAMS